MGRGRLRSKHGNGTHPVCLWLPLVLKAFSPRVPCERDAPHGPRPVLSTFPQEKGVGEGRIGAAMPSVPPDTEEPTGRAHVEPTSVAHVVNWPANHIW